ncbi:hypothetical protein RO3G_05880 [Rhizopus delemar RA 99-880]|jgi:hypothetical protein|uniref:Uncharacterized protein n=1 Tax=Rhizopus delemar (strain RA 99-880 / ATCC MYA-4621 / FGSC 9543 / NRRL 43880) TaxID=246409 RepID=I1BY95_RHIO9|nr:hypothetical protein RO3G_05880 [Rhizopus delemar RA 99-880]|eukprot:EIE81175.1 hypothetical protein RO3G_05880 [Rhizopus delemar RA 99-880]
MNIIAPCPQKPSRYNYYFIEEQVDEACQEIRQILTTSNKMTEEYSIIRTNNPMPHDSSFIIPNQPSVSLNESRPRSFSLGNSRMLSVPTLDDKLIDNLAY